MQNLFMSVDLALAVNKRDWTRYASVLQRDGRVRIEKAFTRATAIELHRHLANDLEWWRAVNRGDQTWDLGPEALAALTDERAELFSRMVEAGAREGFQFLFDTVRVSERADERARRDLLLDRLLSRMNQADMLDRFTDLLGGSRVTLVDGQATRYLPGHFLTGHDDRIAGKGRLAAYVINLTPRWRTEWGGLLLFHKEHGDVVGLAPVFNSIHVFRVPQVHSVSHLAPFAGEPRYAVTGWLRGVD